MESEKTIVGDLHARIDRIVILVAIFWTVVIAGAFVWDYVETYSTGMTIAKSGLEDSFNKDTVYRRWVSIHGGVYVAVTDDMQPNPYLGHVQDRDVTTTTGKQLTLINPAYMTRQVHELAEKQYGHKGHITSLKPLQPQNEPDSWERMALQKFEQGQNEVSSLEPIGNEIYLRFMKPFVVEEGCLKCHGHQGYKVGDIRGGISISTPWKPIERTVFRNTSLDAITHGGIWFIGLVGLLVVRRNIRDNLSERERSELALRESNERYSSFLNTMPHGVQENNLEGVITYSNPAHAGMLGLTPDAVVGRNITEFISDPLESLRLKDYLGYLVSERPTPTRYEARNKNFQGGTIDVAVDWRYMFDKQGELVGFISVITDITELKKAEEEKSGTIIELQNALAEVKKLSGFIPICASCKNIRDDKGYWRQVEEYIRDHSEAEFSHSICPDCARKLYPELYKNQ